MNSEQQLSIIYDVLKQSSKSYTVYQKIAPRINELVKQGIRVSELVYTSFFEGFNQIIITNYFNACYFLTDPNLLLCYTNFFKEFDRNMDTDVIIKLLTNVKIHCIPDPQGQRVGSGGGTLNALLSLKDSTSNDEIMSSKILIIHSGGNSQRAFIHSVCGKAWTTLNSTITTNTDTDDEVELLLSPMVLLIIELMKFSTNLSNGSTSGT